MPERLAAALDALTEATRGWASIERIGMLMEQLQTIFEKTLDIEHGLIVYERQGFLPGMEAGPPRVEWAWGVSAAARAHVDAWLTENGDHMPKPAASQRGRWLAPEDAEDPLLAAPADGFSPLAVGGWPLTYKGQEIGLFVLWRTAAHEDDAPLISFFLAQLAVIFELLVERRIAEETSRRDILTGLWNRQGLLDHVDAMLASTKRHREHLVLAVIDVNNLKSVNDRGGHLAGDAVLRQIAAALAGLVREGDVVGRWGGDEFVLLMQTRRPSVNAIARRLMVLAHSDVPPFSVCVGCSVWGRDGDDWNTCFQVADRRCYALKKWRGRPPEPRSAGIPGTVPMPDGMSPSN